MASEVRKVVILFRATGDAPILKKPKVKIDGSEKFAKVIDYLRHLLHRETLNFGLDGKLVVNYASSMVWG